MTGKSGLLCSPRAGGGQGRVMGGQETELKVGAGLSSSWKELQANFQSQVMCQEETSICIEELSSALSSTLHIVDNKNDVSKDLGPGQQAP